MYDHSNPTPGVAYVGRGRTATAHLHGCHYLQRAANPSATVDSPHVQVLTCDACGSGRHLQLQQPREVAAVPANLSDDGRRHAVRDLTQTFGAEHPAECVCSYYAGTADDVAGHVQARRVR